MVTEWKYASAVEDIPDAVCAQIQNGVVGKEYRAHAQSPNWIGNLVAQIFRLDRTTKDGKARIGAILKILYNKGVITATSGKTGGHGVEIVTVGAWAGGRE